MLVPRVLCLLMLWSPWAIAADRVAPDFRLASREGHAVRLHERVGEVRLLLFVRNDCTRCLFWQRSLQPMSRADTGVSLLVIHDAPYAGKWRRETAATPGISNLRDASGRVHRDYDIEETPTLVVVDREGQLRERFSGDALPDDLPQRIAAIARE